MSDNINICTTGTEEETNALIDYFHTNQSTTTLSSSARDYKGAAAHISTLFKGRPKMVKSIKTKFSHVSFQQYGQHPFKLLIFQQIKIRWTLIDEVLVCLGMIFKMEFGHLQKARRGLLKTL